MQEPLESDDSNQSYRVIWAIDLDASSPEDAVRQAYNVMFDQVMKSSDNPIFQVEGPLEESSMSINEEGFEVEYIEVSAFEVLQDGSVIKR